MSNYGNFFRGFAGVSRLVLNEKIHNLKRVALEDAFLVDRGSIKKYCVKTSA